MKGGAEKIDVPLNFHSVCGFVSFKKPAPLSQTLYNLPYITYITAGFMTYQVLCMSCVNECRECREDFETKLALPPCMSSGIILYFSYLHDLIHLASRANSKDMKL